METRKYRRKMPKYAEVDQIRLFQFFPEVKLIVGLNRLLKQEYPVMIGKYSFGKSNQ